MGIELWIVIGLAVVLVVAAVVVVWVVKQRRAALERAAVPPSAVEVRPNGWDDPYWQAFIFKR